VRKWLKNAKSWSNAELARPALRGLFGTARSCESAAPRRPGLSNVCGAPMIGRGGHAHRISKAAFAPGAKTWKTFRRSVSGVYTNATCEPWCFIAMIVNTGVMPIAFAQIRATF
jgi:hypothetical protein